MAWSRAELELVAAALNITAASYPNDSNLEQKVLYGLKNAAGAAGNGTSIAAPASAVAKTAGGKDL
jgi:hypothetical protein